jgi:hypothetical protein
MNTVREIIKFVMPYYHFEVMFTGKSGSPDISEVRISLLAETLVLLHHLQLGVCGIVYQRHLITVTFIFKVM